MKNFQLLLQAVRTCLPPMSLLRLACHILLMYHPSFPSCHRPSYSHFEDHPVRWVQGAARGRHWGGTVSPRGGGSPQRVWGFAPTPHTGAFDPLAKSRLKVSKPLAQATIANLRTWDGPESVGVNSLPGRDTPSACGMADPFCEKPLASRRRVVASQASREPSARPHPNTGHRCI